MGLLESALLKLQVQTQEAPCQAFMPAKEDRIWWKRPPPIQTPSQASTSLILIYLCIEIPPLHPPATLPTYFVLLSAYLLSDGE